jgi:hypothetical protein
MPNTLQSLFTTEEKPELTWGSLFNWLFVNTLGVPEECRGRIDEWLLGRIMSAALRELGVEEGAASQTVTLVKLATYQRELFLGTADEQSVELLETLLQDTDAQQFLNVNFFQGILWFNRENFETLLRWLVWLVQLNADEAVRAARYATVAKLYEAGQNSGYQVEKLQNALVNADGLSGKAHSLEATAKPLEKEKAADEEKER